MRGLRSFSRQLRPLIIFALALGFLAATEIQAQECVTPFEWQPKLGSQWSQDANNNNVEDEIESLAANETVDVLLDLNACATAQDYSRFEQFGALGYIGRSISVVQLLGVTRAEAMTLAQDSLVAMVQIDHEVTAQLDVSNPAIRVRSSGTYSPNTLQDQFPSLTGAGVNIAIIDTGVDDGLHESLPGAKFVGGFNALTGTEGNPNDDNGHGTHVAGIALGTGGSSGAVRGIAPGAGLVDIKVLGAGGSGTDAGVIAGIDRCIRRRTAWHIGVINLSLGNGTPSNGRDAVSMAVNRAVQAGIVVVVAAGNRGTTTPITAPAAADDALTVAASDDHGTVFRGDDTIAPFSNRGPRLNDGDADTADERKPEVTAPGVHIFSARADTVSGYLELSGTSMAAPHVAGLAALLLQAQPSMTPLAVKQRIVDGAEDFGPAGWDVEWGMGLVNGLAALLGTCTPTDLSISALGTRNPKIVQGVPNFLRATICNNGPAVASAIPVRMGFYGFSNSIAYYPVCTVLSPAGLAPGRCTTVQCPWTPAFSGHRCVTAEILYPCDTNGANNRESRNLDIQDSNSSGAFSMSVVNPTGEDLDVEILTDFDPKCGGWSFSQSHSGFPMGAAVCPVPVSFSLTPLAGTTGSCRVGVRVEGVQPGGARIPLGGGILVGVVPETVKPLCGEPAIGTDPSGRRNVTVSLRDTGSGIVQVNVLKAQNLDVPIPPFVEGTQDPVVVTGTKVVNGVSGILELEIYDASGNVTSCDPLLIEASRTTGKPETQTFTGIPSTEHRLTLSNGTPGITHLQLEVNGTRFQINDLAPGEVRNLDIASALRPGNENTIQLKVTGKPGGEAALLLHD